MLVNLAAVAKSVREYFIRHTCAPHAMPLKLAEWKHCLFWFEIAWIYENVRQELEGDGKEIVSLADLSDDSL